MLCGCSVNRFTTRMTENDGNTCILVWNYCYRQHHKDILTPIRCAIVGCHAMYVRFYLVDPAELTHCFFELSHALPFEVGFITLCPVTLVGQAFVKVPEPCEGTVVLSVQAAGRRLDSADVMMKGPEGVMKYRPLHAQLVGRRCRMATMLGHVYAIGPQTGNSDNKSNNNHNGNDDDDDDDNNNNADNNSNKNNNNNDNYCDYNCKSFS